MKQIQIAEIKTIKNEVVRDPDNEIDGWMHWKQSGLQIITLENGFRIRCKNITMHDEICEFEPIAGDW